MQRGAFISVTKLVKIPLIGIVAILAWFFLFMDFRAPLNVLFASNEYWIDTARSELDQSYCILPQNPHPTHLQSLNRAVVKDYCSKSELWKLGVFRRDRIPPNVGVVVVFSRSCGDITVDASVENYGYWNSGRLVAIDALLECKDHFILD